MDVVMHGNTVGEIFEDADAILSLYSMKNDERIPLELAALTVLELNRVIVTGVDRENLNTLFKSLTQEQIRENSQQLLKYGILPPIELSQNGSARSKRISSPSPKKLAILSEKTEKEERQKFFSNKKRIKEDAKRYRDGIDQLLQNNLNSGVLTQFSGTTYETLNPYLKSFDVCHPDARIATKFTDALFPTPVVSYWKNTLSRSCRQIWEPTNPTTQCNNTIGPVVENVTTCYICGFGFSNETGLEATCEHILPIIQAIFFLDLYRPSERDQIIADEAKMTVLRNEYSWAHQCCNYIKSDVSFLKTVINADNNYPSWEFNEVTTTRMLEYIQNPAEGKFVGSQTIKQKINNDANWLQQRLAYIRDQKMNNIVNYISGKGNGGIIMMMGYGNCVDASKINKDFKVLLSQFETKSSISLTPRASTSRNSLAIKRHVGRIKTARNKK